MGTNRTAADYRRMTTAELQEAHASAARSADYFEGRRYYTAADAADAEARLIRRILDERG